jgi:hypothetical protein
MHSRSSSIEYKSNGPKQTRRGRLGWRISRWEARGGGRDGRVLGRRSRSGLYDIGVVWCRSCMVSGLHGIGVAVISIVRLGGKESLAVVITESDSGAVCVQRENARPAPERIRGNAAEHRGAGDAARPATLASQPSNDSVFVGPCVEFGSPSRCGLADGCIDAASCAVPVACSPSPAHVPPPISQPAAMP